MRFERLDLKPFGQFADHSLDLPETGLAIVYGLNGAGKTTVRRAIGDLLFGIPGRSPDVWKFQTAIRVGALFSGLGGDAQVEMVRHKGRKDTLKDPNGEVLDDSILNAVLGGLTREKFEGLYSITQQELREGGEELASGKGELASLVFSAGLGSTQVSALLRELEEEADALYKDQGKKQVIPSKIKAFKDRKAEAAEKLVLPDEWSRREQELKLAEAERQQIRKEIAELNTGLARRTRHVELKPMLLEHSKLAAEEQGIEVPRSVNASTRAKREAAEETLGKAEEEFSSTEKELERIDGKLAALEVNDSLVGVGVEIDQLGQEASAIQKALQDETKLLVQKEAAEAEIAESLQELGGNRTEQEAVEMMPSSATELEMRRLGDEFRELDRTRTQEFGNIRKLEEEVAGKQGELDLLGEEEDGERITEVGQAATAEGPIEDDLDSLNSRRAEVEKELNQGLRNLYGFSGGLGEFRELEVPLRQIIKDMETRLGELNSETQQVATKLDEVEDELEERRANLRALSGSGSVPSLGELEEARSLRRRGWEAVLAAWKKGDEGPGRDFAPGSSLPEAYEASVDRADAVSDDLRENAEKVTQIAAMEVDISRLEGRAERLQSEKRKLGESRQELDREWEEQWQGSGVEPKDPTAMLEWTEEIRELKKRITEIDELDVKIEERRERVDFHRAELEAVLASGVVSNGGGDPEGSGRRLRALLEIARRRVEGINKAKSARAALVVARDESMRRLDAATAARQEAEGELEEWEERWTPLTEKIAADGVPGPDGVLRTLEVLKELKVRKKQRDDLSKRIEGIRRDVSEFIGSVKAVVSGAVVEVDPVERKNVVTLVRGLQEQLGEALKDKQKIDSLQESRATATERKAKAEENLDHARTTLSELLQQSGAGTPQELERFEDAFSERSGKAEARTTLERQILQAGGGALDELTQQVEGLDVDELRVEIAGLEGDIQSREERLSELDEVITEVRLYQLQADQTGDALKAENAAEQLANELREDVEQYAKLRIAIEMLKRAMASYREDAEGPVLKKAGELFTGINGEVFQGLETMEGEDGEPVLVARRHDELPTHVSELSDGERDSLYLVFRIASIEYQFQKLEANQRIPIILDDVFVSMDDEKAKVGLEYLTRLSGGCQVIFLTHHDHLVDLARNTLPAEAFGITELQRPAA